MLQLQAVCDFILLLQPFMASSKPLATRLHMLIADGVEKKAINWYCNLFLFVWLQFRHAAQALAEVRGASSKAQTKNFPAQQGLPPCARNLFPCMV